METFTVKAELSISKPVHEVFQAALNPAPFFVKKTSGPLEEGAEITWEFQELPKEFPVQVKKVERDKLIRFTWPRDDGSAQNTVDFSFKRFSDNITTIYVSESGWPAEEKYRESSYRNCMGWTHMACSLKAYLEYGVNLRQGSFVHMKFD